MLKYFKMSLKVTYILHHNKFVSVRDCHWESCMERELGLCVLRGQGM